MTDEHRPGDRGGLAVLTKDLGRASETFIRRHVHDLCSNLPIISLRGQVPGSHWELPGQDHLVLFPRSLAGHAAFATRLLHGAVSVPPLRRPRLERQDAERVIDFLRGHHRNTVLCEYLDPWVDLTPFLDRAGLRVFVHGHGYDLSRRPAQTQWARLYRRAYSNIDGIVVPSHHAANRLIEIGLPPDVLYVVPYGISIPEQLPDADPLSDGGVLRCLAVGRLVPKKAPIALLASIAQAAHNGANIRLDLVGDGPLRDDVAGYVKGEGLSEVVTLHGAVPNETVGSLLASAHVFVQHSVQAPDGDEEGLPVAILEAMAHGLPVVSTRHAGIPEAITHGHEGLLVTEHDVHGFAAHLVRLADDPDLVRALGSAARDRAERYFSWDTERQELRSLLCQ